jgi:hypothetical protein
MSSSDKYFVPIEERRVLIENEVTLNGVRASIGGVNNDFATVRQMPSGMGVDFAWITVKHIIENHNGEFRA